MHSGGKNKGELTFLEARGALLYFFSPNNDRDTWVLSCVPARRVLGSILYKSKFFDVAGMKYH